MPAAVGPEPARGYRLGVELAVFTVLGGLGIAQWSRLVADPPAGRLVLALAIVTVAAAALALVGLRRPRRAVAIAAATAIAIVATAAAAVAVGLPARLLLPSNWSELIDNLSLGLAGIEDTEMPYAGGDVWLRLTLLLGAPLLLGAAAATGFWPARRRTLRRTVALGLLVTLYAIAVTLDSPGAELAWGLLLLVLCVAWLWAPGLTPRRAGRALAVTVGAGLLALPLAARLDPATPWWNYESWDWFGRDREVEFEWDHRYGPLEWPREGTTLLEVQSAEPLYWKASVLDRFDGFSWQRAQGSDLLASAERSARRRSPGAAMHELHPEWRAQASFEVEALASPLAIGAGTTQVVQGLDGVGISADGTLRLREPLTSGTGYSIVAYAPRPSAEQLREAPARYPRRRFRHTTLVGLPATVAPVFETGPASSTGNAEGDGGPIEGGFAPARPQAMPLWGEPRDPEIDATMRISPYADVYRRAQRLTAGAGTPYEAVLAVQRHLRENYDYSPNVPQHTYPLSAFMFDDLAGYCQQFAGSMALMLRMVGIPTRVVSGFAPGSYDSERRVYEVRDTDAHSWVEAYFRGIGWVTFDPTPAAAPAASQTLNAAGGTFFRGRGSVGELNRELAREREPALEGGRLGDVSADDGPWSTVALVLLAIGAVAAAAAGLAYRRRRHRLVAGESVDAQLDELRGALGRLGWKLPGETTLFAIERRFGDAGRPAVAGYAAGLRAHRFAPGSPPPPGPGARRALRRALADGGGLRRRLRALVALPPGGPR
jgi:transglutaminase-like putative cysteine protease